jgi:hypothetical protein
MLQIEKTIEILTLYLETYLIEPSELKYQMLKNAFNLQVEINGFSDKNQLLNSLNQVNPDFTNELDMLLFDS